MSLATGVFPRDEIRVIFARLELHVVHREVALVHQIFVDELLEDIFFHRPTRFVDSQRDCTGSVNKPYEALLDRFAPRLAFVGYCALASLACG